MFLIVFLIVSTVAVVSVSTASPGPVVIYVDPPTSTAAPTGTFAVDINIVNIMAEKSLYGWEFWMSFNTAILDAVSVVQGPFLKDTGYFTFFSKKIDNTAGTVAVGGMISELPLPPTGAVGNGTLCTITFLVEAEGADPLHFKDTELATIIGEYPDQFNVPIYHTAEDGYFSSSPPTTQYDLTIAVDGSGTTDPLPGVYTYAGGVMASVTAIPDSGYVLDHWELDGDPAGSDISIDVTMDDDHALTAFFTLPEITYDLTIAVDGSGTTDPLPGVYTYAGGVMASVTAIPDSGYVLDHWELDGDPAGSDISIDVTMDDDHALTAFFAVSKAVISVEPSSSTAEVGEDFTVNINITDVSNLYFWEFFMSFNDPKKDTWTGDNVTKSFVTTEKPVLYETQEIYVNHALMPRVTEETDTWTGDGMQKTFYTTMKPIVEYSEMVTVNFADTWAGDGEETTFLTTEKSIVEGSEKVYVNQILMTKPANYDINPKAGIIVFTTAPGDGAEIEATYRATVEKDVDYAVDYVAGTVTFTTALENGAEIKATYEYALYTIDYPTGTTTFTTAPGLEAEIEAIYLIPPILEVVSVMEGHFLSDVDSTSLGIMPPYINNSAGTVKAANLLWNYPPTGAVGNGTLCTITFQVKDVGNTTLRFYHHLLATFDGMGVPLIGHTVEDGYFSVYAPSPIEVLEELIETIETWNLSKGAENSLTSKLDNTIHQLNKGNDRAASHKLTAFTNQVEALQDRKLTPEQADYLISEAQRIIDLINGGTP